MVFIRCDICNIGVNTPEQLSNHQLGKQHMKNLKRVQFERSMAANNSSTSSGFIPANNAVRQSTTSETSDLSTRLSNLNVTTIYCDICETSCNTPEQMKIHEAGSKHQRKLALLRPTDFPDESEYRVEMCGGNTKYCCIVCSDGNREAVRCDTLEQLQNHLRGTSHMKRKSDKLKMVNKPPVRADFDRCPGGAVGTKYSNRDNLNEFLCNNCEEWLPSASVVRTHVCKPLRPAPPQKSAWPDLPAATGGISQAFTHNASMISTPSRWDLGSDRCSDTTSYTTSTDLPLVPSSAASYTTYQSSTSSESSPRHSVLSSSSSSSRTPAFDAAFRSRVVIQENEHEFICVYCAMSCNTAQSMEAHLSGSRHMKKARALGRPAAIEQPNSYSNENGPMLNDEVMLCPADMVKCIVCNLKLNRNNLDAHLAGKKHAEKRVKSLRAPSCPVNRPALIRDVQLSSISGDDAFVKTKQIPRQYQWELFVKAMRTDTIIYLPTGTGKTMVAALVIGEMLHRNPHYQAIFLVDKTLLALQQSDYLREQLGDFMVDRFDWNSKLVENRKLRIACLCGDLHQLQGGSKESLWQQDIIVTTVGFYQNLIQSNIVNMDNVGLITIDEAHHCVKDHPYHRLLNSYHKPLPRDRRPKLLGLTASPAGSLTLQETQSELRSLLSNMGDIEVVATEHASDELTEFTSRNNTRCVVIPMESLERDLQQHLIMFAIEVLSVALPGSPHVTSLKREMQTNSPNWDIIPKMLEHQSNLCRYERPDVADLVVDCIDSFFKLESGDWELACIDVEKVCRSADAFENSNPELTKSIRNVRASVDAIKVSNASGIEISPVMRFLVKAVSAGLKGKDQSNGMVIVLTGQRSVARSVTDYLSSHMNEGDKRETSAICLVGHGSTSGAKQKALLGDRAELTKGMSVTQQRRALSEIKDGEHQVIVATSVAEEGVDLPACGLVILLTPPSTMSAVVQMRGRARLKNSYFVVLCRQEDQKLKFNNLLKREANMFTAVKDMCREQEERRINKVSSNFN